MKVVRCPTCLYSKVLRYRRASGALKLVGVLRKRVDDHHAQCDDHYREYRCRRDDKQPPDGSETGEEVAHYHTESSSSQEVYPRIQRDERDEQVEDAPENEVRIHQVARGCRPPASAGERQERAQNFEASHHEHHDGGEGDHTWPSRHCPARTFHGIADPSRLRFTMLRHTSSFPSLALCLRATLYQSPFPFPSRPP